MTWPAALPRTLEYPEVPVGAILAGSARRFGERAAFHQAGRELSYAELGRWAARLAHALRANGIGSGDVVAVLLGNCLAYPVAYYGILLVGATFSPVNPLLPADALVAQLADCGAVAVLARHGVELPVRLVVGTDGTDFGSFTDGQPDTAPDVEIDLAHHLAHLAYTGGTTGASKGVELPHRNVVVNSLQYACWATGSVPARDAAGGLVLDQVGPASEWPTRLGTGVAVNLSPWFHAMGTISALNCAVLAGTTTVIHERFDPAAYLADAERFAVTSISGAPPMFHAMLAGPDIATRDLSSVRSISSGAAPLAVELIGALRARFPDAVIAEGYGLTEVTMGATAGLPNRSGEFVPGTVGIPVFDTEVRVVADGSEQPVPAGERGEVCIRGPQVMVGYHGHPEATAEVLVDGWLHTGDIGILDERGFLSIVDRKKDMLLYKGYNVYPRQLEELLFRQPAVAMTAVVGRPDAAVGELPVAFVVLRSGAAAPGPAELMAAVNAELAPYQRLRELHVVDTIPVSAAGKVLKRELRDQLAQVPAW